MSVFGLVGAAIKWILNVVEDAIKEDIYILAETGSAINYDVGLSYNKIDGFAPSTKQRVIVDLTFTFKAGIKDKQTIFIANTSRMERNVITANEAEQETFKIEGSVTTGIRY